MTAASAQDTRFRLSASQARSLAEAYGTPLYVIDETHFRAKIRAYRDAFREVEPTGEISYASKANSTVALLAIAASEGCSIDVASEGELRAALKAGVPADRCHLHGNNKQPGEIAFALEQGIGAIVVDHFAEIETIASHPLGKTKVIMRLAPGVDPITHAKISTGQADTKFGFNVADGAAERATRRCLELNLPLIGYHCHVGSQLLDPEAQCSGGEIIARFAVEMKTKLGFETTYLNVGGGLGVRYTGTEDPLPIREYCARIVRAVRGALEGSGLTPALAQEPGRSLIAEAGVTLYRVGVIKTVPARERGSRTYVAVDGGLSDNPRPAMYGAKYAVERPGHEAGWAYVTDGPGAVDCSAATQTVTVSGKHCETDLMFPDVEVPSNLAEGDLLQVLCTGAYNASMASNYNRYPRPATALIRPDGSHALIQRRDTWDEMLAREFVPEDLR